DRLRNPRTEIVGRESGRADGFAAARDRSATATTTSAAAVAAAPAIQPCDARRRGGASRGGGASGTAVGVSGARGAAGEAAGVSGGGHGAVGAAGSTVGVGISTSTGRAAPTKRYPIRGTVSMYSDESPLPPRARRMSHTLRFRFVSSTTASGHSADISSCL